MVTSKYVVDCTDYDIQFLCYMLAYSLQHADCAGVVFYSVTCALVAAQYTNGKPMATVELDTV